MSDLSIKPVITPLPVAEAVSAFLRAVERRTGGRPLLTRVYGSPTAAKLSRRFTTATDGRVLPLAFERT